MSAFSLPSSSSGSDTRSESLRPLNRAIELSADYTYAYIVRGLVYYDQKKYEEAIANYDRAIELNPENEDVYSNRGDAYYEQEKYEEVVEDYSQALKLNPDDNVYEDRGYSYLYLKDVEQARADFSKAAEIEPDDVNMAWMVIFTSLGKERPGRAVIEELEIVARMDPQVAEA